MIYLAPRLLERCLPLRAAPERPALTALALLAVANPEVAAQLLRDPLGAAQAHPHYPIQLDEDDRRLLISIRSRTSLTEFLAELADAIEASC
jgi:hypothetical protein